MEHRRRDTKANRVKRLGGRAADALQPKRVSQNLTKKLRSGDGASFVGGLRPGNCRLLESDETAGKTVERYLASAHYACVVIGAGIRLPPQGLALFEVVVNAVHTAAPDAAIAFDTVPEDSAEAAVASQHGRGAASCDYFIARNTTPLCRLPAD